MHSELIRAKDVSPLETNSSSYKSDLFSSTNLLLYILLFEPPRSLYMAHGP